MAKRKSIRSIMAEDAAHKARRGFANEIASILKARGQQHAGRSNDCRDLKNHDEAHLHTVRSMECQDIATLIEELMNQRPIWSRAELRIRLRMMGLSAK